MEETTETASETVSEVGTSENQSENTGLSMGAMVAALAAVGATVGGWALWKKFRHHAEPETKVEPEAEEAPAVLDVPSKEVE